MFGTLKDDINCDTPIPITACTSRSLLIFVSMGYESVSALLVLIILVALWFGWLPKHTVNGMKSILEHREDRYSPSLHLVDEWSATRVCDGTRTTAKGVDMQPTEQKTERKQRFTKEYINHIRSLRRAAVRRRCMLVLALAVLTFLVALVGFGGLYSPAFALIPLAFLAIVLVCGARASKHARAWEARVASMRRKDADGVVTANVTNVSEQVITKNDDRFGMVNSFVNTVKAITAGASDFIDAKKSEYGKTVNKTHFVKENREDYSNGNTDYRNASYENSSYSNQNYVQDCQAVRDSTETSIMEAREIRVALRRTMKDREEALRKRGLSMRSDENMEVIDVADAAKSNEVPVSNLSTPESNDSSSVKDSTQSSNKDEVEQAEQVEQTKNVEQSEKASYDDSTNEISEVRASKALDAFDLAASAQSEKQDLISFSLGSKSSANYSKSAENSEKTEKSAASSAPESLEIKSTKQVAKAVPSKPVAVSAANSADKSVEEFHNSEKQAKVEAPDSSADSLGVANLREVLASRRR